MDDGDDDNDDDDDPSTPAKTSAAAEEEEKSEAPSRANFHARNTKRHASDARAARTHPSRARKEKDANVSPFAFARV